MTVLQADTNGGRMNMVHRQTDDGKVISVISGDSLLPLTFRYEDYLGDIQETLIAGNFFPHKRLMRGDKGWRAAKDDSEILFSWDAKEERIDGFSSGPDGEYRPITSSVRNKADDVRLCDVNLKRTKFWREDMCYWTPDKTAQADAAPEFFGFSQFNPAACEPKKPNNCGLVTLEDD